MNFEDFLKRKNIPQKKISFYQFWVSLYNQFCNKKKLNYSKSNSITAFTSYIGKQYEEWQVVQAKEAIKLFRYYEDAYNKDNSTRNTVDLRPLKKEWETVETDMVKMLRLKQRSY